MKKILRYIVCIFTIIMFPFIFPLITRFLIHIKLYNNIEEFKNYISIFFESGFIWVLAIGLLAVYFIVCDKDRLIKWIESRDFFLKLKNASIESKASEIVDESDKKKKFINNFNSDLEEDTKLIKKEMKEELKQNKKRNEKNSMETNNIESLQNENNNLRFYSAYNIINKKTRELLNVIYCDKNMELAYFKNELIYSFKNRNRKNKNLTKFQINEYANNKYETIKNGLQYLNIIEISDDDENITLTPYGKEFVEKYIEKEVGENEN